jgi:hypothetical protein
MGRTRKAEKALLEMLKESPKSKKAIKKTAKTKNLVFEKKHVKKALQKLREQGAIVKTGKDYSIAPSVGQASATSFKPTTEQNETVPIAEKLRQNAKKDPRKKVTFEEPKVDVDEEIRRLEMELQQSDDSDDDSSLEPESAIEGHGSLCLSKYADDRVENLPASSLPLPGRYDANDRKAGKNKNQVAEGGGHERGSGLRQAVKELFQGYQARSSERLPFYCRFCSKQYRDETEFLDHRQTEFHVTAVAVEKKATYCRLCRKQLTSPEQMKEHLASKPHKEKLQSTINYQRSNPRQKKDSTRRQWV